MSGAPSRTLSLRGGLSELARDAADDVGAGSVRPVPNRADALFRRYRSSGDMRAREQLIEQFLPLARGIAGRYRGTPEHFDDLCQVASLALVKAVDGFDPERGLAFSSYAVPTILGELKRHFRDTGWSLHVPRALQERVLAAERGERDLSATLGRAPTVEELADAIAMSEEEVLEALEARSAHDTESIDALRGGDEGQALVDSIGDDDVALDLAEERQALAGPIAELSQRDRRILELRFVEDLTQTEIAGRIGISQMQVSRILRRTLEQLREGL